MVGAGRKTGPFPLRVDGGGRDGACQASGRAGDRVKPERSERITEMTISIGYATKMILPRSPDML